MSLINKMLQDLDARRDDSASGKQVFDDLRPARQQVTGSSRSRLWLLLTALFLVSGASAGYAYVYLYDGQLSWPTLSFAKKSDTAVVKDAETPVKGQMQIKGQPPIIREPLNDDTTTVAEKAVSLIKTAKLQQSEKAVTTAPVTAKKPKQKTLAKQRRKPRRVRSARTATKRIQTKSNRRSASMRVASASPVLDKTAVANRTGVTITLGKGITKKIQPATPSQQAELRYRAALTSMRQQQLAQAEKQLREALALDPKHIEARELLVGVLVKNGLWPEAEKLLQQGMALSPQHYRFVQLLARLVVERGDDNRAVKLLEASAPYGRQDPYYIAFLATMYQRVGQHDKAVKTFGHALRFKPREGRWWLGVGVSLEAKNQWTAARQAYQRAIVGVGLSNNLVLYAQQRLAVLKKRISNDTD